MADQPPSTAEHARLAAQRAGRESWRRWGPYLSERQWGTVREDYSAGGESWEYFSHEQARSRAYRWGEDGLGGICDHEGRLCFAVALWNGRDPILKERLYGLTNGQGNHGEDVKELYYYLDATPSHSYLKFLYKYPQGEFPYGELVTQNAARGKQDPEFELLDTGLFSGDRYFDVFVEYAKAGVDDILVRITLANRGPDAAELEVLPTLWFRNVWSWPAPEPERPRLWAADEQTIAAQHAKLGSYRLRAEGSSELLFTDNDSNLRVFGTPAATGYFKDAFHDYVVAGRREAVNPARWGTKAAARYRLRVEPGETQVLRLRLAPAGGDDPPGDFDLVFAARQREADEFYAFVQGELADDDARRVHRQALAGMIWSKQFYHFDVGQWLAGDPGQPAPPPERRRGRNRDWQHLNNADIVSMPDKWEYPWYAAWDLAFHCLPLALVDAEFAKTQLVLLTREWAMHPNGQLPAYEWNFGDVNPPVHAWATWRVFQIDRKQRGDCGDLAFLERVFHKLLLNFTWWVNRKDALDRNVFQGGFLGLDNIGVFDRSRPLPTGGFINQADGTAWMAMYCLNLLRMSLELALHNPVYEDIASKFFEHFLYIAQAMTDIGGEGIGLWDEDEQFYFDELVLPDGQMIPLRVRSLVGLIPLCAVETLEPATLERLPGFRRRLNWFLKNRPELSALVSRWEEPGAGERRLLSLCRGSRMKKILRRMLDETEFLSPYGLRSVSQRHRDEPYVFRCGDQELRVAYQPAESDSYMFGGNSNWRGPIWFPLNYLLIESLQKFHHYYGDDFKVECPTGSGQYLTIEEVANELGRRLTRIILRDESGERAVFGGDPKLNHDPHFRDYLPFYEYFHGDDGRGLGAAHQTGWTGLVAKLLQPRRADAAPGPGQPPEPLAQPDDELGSVPLATSEDAKPG